MPALVPLRVNPATVTVLLVPTFLSLKVPVAAAAFRVTESPLTTPANVAPAVFSVAELVASYILSWALMPATVSAFVFTICDRGAEVLPLKLESPP